MSKMTIERFNEIKARLDEIAKLIEQVDNEELEVSEEEAERINDEINGFFDEVHVSDLSDIPFEAYEDFKDIGFDFSGTGANLDFSLIDLSNRGRAPVRAKGCNVRSLDNIMLRYDDESFDDKVKDEHPEMFLSTKEYSPEIRQKYYRGSLSERDIIAYGLYEMLEKEEIASRTKDFFQKMPVEVAKALPQQIFRIEAIDYSLMNKLRNYDGEITEEIAKALIKEVFEEKLNGSFLSKEDYKEIASVTGIDDYLPEGRIIRFQDDDLLDKYIDESLRYRDIAKNKETFRGKYFISHMSNARYSSTYNDITEDKVLYFLDNFSDFPENVLDDTSVVNSIIRELDPEKDLDENRRAFSGKIMELLKGEELKYYSEDEKAILSRYVSLEDIAASLDEYTRYKYDQVMQYTNREKLEELGVSPSVLQSGSVLDLFRIYGLETVMEFDRQNDHVFSKNDFALAKEMNKYYFHYSGNNHDPNTSIAHRITPNDDWSAPFVQEDFEEMVRRMIVYGPTDYDYGKEQPIDFRNFSDRFKERFPSMFISENAPQELQDKYYTKALELEDFKEHPEWKDYFDNVDFEIGVNLPFVYLANSQEYEHASLLDFIKKDLSGKEALDFFIDNFETIKLYQINRNIQENVLAIDFSKITDSKSVIELMEERLTEGIIDGKIAYGEPYIFESFKENHPEYVLDENAPRELKQRYYSLLVDPNNPDRNEAYDKNLRLEDLINPEFIPFLKGKGFELLRNSDQVKNLTKVFNYDEIIELYEMDPQGFELYAFNPESAYALKNALETVPDNFAREELQEGLKITKEELEERLSNDLELQEKFASLKQGYRVDMVKNPGFNLSIEPENRTRQTLKEYKMLSANNMLHQSNRFSRDSYEQILGHMLDSLGYDESRKLLEVPEIDEDTLDHIYAQDEIIKSLYEKKFEITGNLKVLGKLFEGVPGLMPTPEKITSKQTCKVFMSINKRIQEGYDKDAFTLLTEALQENNIPVDETKIVDLVSRVTAISAAQKLELVRESNSAIIDTSIDENQKTKNMIKMHYKNALEHSLTIAEKVDPSLVRSYLEKEFRRTNVNGDPYYSSHVTDHLEELVSFAQDLAQDPEKSELLNHSIVDDLQTEAGKIGKGWIRKITSNICQRPDKLTYEEATHLDEMIYPEGSGLEVDTKGVIGLRVLTKEEKDKVYELLNNEQFRGLFSYGKAENMFSTLRPPYSKNFVEYFLKNKDEFIGNPDLFTVFPVIASKFDTYLEEPSFATRFQEGTLKPEDILLKLKVDVYPNIVVGKGEHDVIYEARNAGLQEEQVKVALNLFKEMKQREYQTVPQEEYSTKRFRGRIVRMDSPLHFAIGKVTDCCQTIGKGQPGESSMVHSATERNGSLFVVEEYDETGKSLGVVSQSWTWRNGNRVCFDNVEIPRKVESKLIQEGGFDEIMSVYREAATRMIDTDKKKLDNLLKQGKITKAQYDEFVIKDVTMGLGCDNLVGNLSNEERTKYEFIGASRPKELGKTYTGSFSRTLYTDAGTSILVAHNDDFAPDDHKNVESEVGNYGVQYIKPREVISRKGIEIDPDKVDIIAEKYPEATLFGRNPISINEVAKRLKNNDQGVEDLRLAMSDTADWYILGEETDSGLMIHESGIDMSEPESDIQKADRKMALAEYTREVYKLVLEGHAKGKHVTVDLDTRTKFFKDEPNLTSMSQEELQAKIEDYDKLIDASRRDRLLLSPEEKEVKDDNGER